jgi:nitrite reductase/ring-hydroxylating ferredoxin subunit
MADYWVAAGNDLPAGTVVGARRYAVGNNGDYFAVTRRCRHLGADLAHGSIDADGCLVCPWHKSKYDVRTGRMVRGPQGIFARIPGLGALNMALTKVLPLGRGKVERRGSSIVVDRAGPIGRR